MNTNLEIAAKLVNAIAKNDVALERDIQKLADLKLTYDDYKTLRAGFVAVHVKAGKSEGAAGKRWERLLKAVGVEKPASTSAAATAKRAQRAKAAPAKAGQPDKTSSSPETKAPTTGKAKAEAVKMELSPLEANIIKWLRSGQWAMLDAAIKAQRDTAAPV